MELAQNRSLTLTTGNENKAGRGVSKMAYPRDLTWLLFNNYITVLPIKTSKKYAHAEGLALMHADENWQVLEKTLTLENFPGLSPNIETEAQRGKNDIVCFPS